MTEAAETPVIEMRGIDKAFGPVRALANVDFRLGAAKYSASSATTRPASRR